MNKHGLPTILGGLVTMAGIASVDIAFAQGTGTLGDPRAGKLARYSSYERSGGNADFRRVAPGETLTLVDHQGAGTLRRLWLTRFRSRNHYASTSSTAGQTMNRA
ncbi:MAG: hypothetical protein H8F28_06500 [Fibrella sp.]|nr:hypothetical protein [Armatimonadota bacterium]